MSQPLEPSTADLVQLQTVWSRAPDHDVQQAAFANITYFPYAARAVIYREFVSRGLCAPDEPVKPAVSLPKERWWTVTLQGFGVYVLAFIVWTLAIGALGLILAKRGIALGGIIWLALSFMPPGFAACAHVASRTSGFRPDPEGHTRCGQCGYILRGLSEPRCPECGRQI